MVCVCMATRFEARSSSSTSMGCEESEGYSKAEGTPTRLGGRTLVAKVLIPARARSTIGIV